MDDPMTHPNLMSKRRAATPVNVGGVRVGGDAPIVV
jgi:hypothetical protein